MGSAGQAFTQICQQLIPDGKAEAINAVCETFIRKYTHARIGGHIRGKAEREAERKGVRSKGASSLRDKLYNVSAKQKDAVKKKSLAKKK
jgi:hypothetical protein